jgi:hypothetical protein
VTPSAGWIVKVLDGAVPRQSSVLPLGRVTIGHALSNDIVLRDPSVKGHRVALDLDSGSPRIQVLDGEMSVLGHSLAAPASALLPPYTPISLGGLQLAYGELDGPRWRDAERLAAAVRADTEKTGPKPAPVSDLNGVGAALRRTGIYAPFALGVLALGLALVAANGSVRSVAHASAPSQLRPLTSGHLTGLTDRAEDLFMSAGLTAKVAMDGPDGLTITLPDDADPSVADAARRHLLRENSFLKRANIVFGKAAGSVAVPAGPGQRIVAAVGGPDGYLVAADGSKYFPGGHLPTGQVLKSVDRDRIVFDQDGVSTQLDIKEGGLK